MASLIFPSFLKRAINKGSVVNNIVNCLINNSCGPPMVDSCNRPCASTWVWIWLLLCCHDLPFSFRRISAAVSVNTNKPQRTSGTPVHLIKISEKLLWTAAAASVLLWGLFHLCLSIYLLLWQTGADYYPGCTGDSSHYSNFLFLRQLPVVLCVIH